MHRVCVYHLFNNLRANFKENARQIKESFNAATGAYTTSDSEYYMRQLDKIDDRTHPYLVEVGFEKQSKVFSKNNIYSFMTSNIVEYMNSTKKVAKELRITPLVEGLRSLVEK